MEQNSSFTQLSIPLAKSGKNYAPTKPLEELLRNKKPNLKNPTKFEQSIREWYQSKLNYEKVSRDEQISRSHLVSLFRKGDQLLQRRPFGAPGYYVRPIQNDDTVTRQTVMNIMTFHSQISESKLMAVNPTVNMRPGDDTPEAIAAAQACRPVVDNYETDWYTAKFTRRESIRLLTDGIVVHQVRWNPFKGEYQSQERKVSRREVVIDPGSGVCADCQHEAEADEFEPTNFGNKCPQCGSEAVDIRPPMKQNMAQIGMGEQKPVGEPEIISSAFAQWHWDMTVDLEMSSWAIKRQKITQGDINLMLGDVVIPDSASSADYGLEVLHALTYSGQAFQGQSNSQWHQSVWEKQPTMAEAWMSPSDQAMIECEEGDTICGIKMPKGKMSDFFRGADVCIVGLNDMSVIVGTYANESQKSEVVTAQWYMDADSGGGRGMEDTAAVQRRFNAVDGQLYQGLATTATPPVFIDMRMLKEDNAKYLFKPGVNHDINLSMLPVGMKMQDAMYLPQPGQVSQQFMGYGTEFLAKNMANLSSLAVEFSDLLSIDNRTATGAQISSALANSLYGPMLMSKSESRVEIAKKIVCLQGKHGVVGRFFPGKGDARGRMVDGQSLQGKVIFELVPNTHLPVTPYSQQSDVSAFLQAFGGNPLMVGQMKDAYPALFKAISRPFSSLQFDDETDDEISTLCLGRLQQMKEALEAGVDDPQMLVQMIQPPVSAKEPKQKEKQTWWASWLDLDSAQKSPLVLRQAAEAMWDLHENLMTQTAMPQAANAGLVAGIGAAAQAAPAALGATALQQQQPQEQGDDQRLELEAEHAAQESEQAHESRMKDKELETQKEITRLQGQNQLATTKEAGKNQIAAVKARPKPTVKKTAA
jgi:hypothetical protein